MDAPEQACPSTDLMPADRMRLAMATACFGSQASSWIEILIVLPLTPPFLLIASAASSAPRLICSPIEATGPVIGAATAIVTSCAWATPAAVISDSTDKEYNSLAFMIFLPFVDEGRVFQCPRPCAAPLLPSPTESHPAADVLALR